MLFKNIFLKTLRDYRWTLFGWAIGLAVLVFLTVSFYPAFSSKAAGDLNKLFQQLPDALKAFVGNEADYTSPTGYLNSQLYVLNIPLFLIIFGITLGSSLLAKEEDRGTLELLLSAPKSRNQILIQKFLATVIITVVLTGIIYLSTYLSAKIFNVAIGQRNLLLIHLPVFLIGMVSVSIAMLFSVVNGKRSTGIAVATIIMTLSYFINFFGMTVKWLKPLRKFTVFYFYGNQDVLVRGLNFKYLAVLSAIVIFGLLITLVIFNRRDLSI
ncbi:MAG: ABC transporter permease subunit [bacterium]|nr:ABC transporter permease subunit [bacterium]